VYFDTITDIFCVCGAIERIYQRLMLAKCCSSCSCVLCDDEVPPVLPKIFRVFLHIYSIMSIILETMFFYNRIKKKLRNFRFRVTHLRRHGVDRCTRPIRFDINSAGKRPIHFGAESDPFDVTKVAYSQSIDCQRACIVRCIA
jgi:hypothetical protein